VTTPLTRDEWILVYQNKSTSLCEGVEQPKRSPKKNPGNAFSDALLMSRFKIRRLAGAAKKKPRKFFFPSRGLIHWLLNSFEFKDSEELLSSLLLTMVCVYTHVHICIHTRYISTHAYIHKSPDHVSLLFHGSCLWRSSLHSISLYENTFFLWKYFHFMKIQEFVFLSKI